MKTTRPVYFNPKQTQDLGHVPSTLRYTHKKRKVRLVAMRYGRHLSLLNRVRYLTLQQNCLQYEIFHFVYFPIKTLVVFYLRVT